MVESSYYDCDMSDYMDDNEMRTDEERAKSCADCEHLVMCGVNYGGLCAKNEMRGVTLDGWCLWWEARI